MTGNCTTLNISSFNETKKAVLQDPTKGKGEFKTITTWKDGALAETTARSFKIKTDEPTPLGGGDTAIDPMELILANKYAAGEWKRAHLLKFVMVFLKKFNQRMRS